MSRKKSAAGTSFWVGYSDLMTSLFFVFLVVATTLALGFRYQANINDAKAKELDRIRSVTRIADKLTANNRFTYNEQCDRYELKEIFNFTVNSALIPSYAKNELIAAGREIEQLIESTEGKTDIRFKVVIEGRAARHIDKPWRNKDPRGSIKVLSYSRALAVSDLWTDSGVNLNTVKSELFIAGSGFDGLCRYPAVAGEEEKNKRIIVQVIPFLARD